MSHLTADGEHLHPTEKPLNSVVPPDDDKLHPSRTEATADEAKSMAQRGAQWIRENKDKPTLPLDEFTDDPARDKVLSDSVRAGVVDDVGIEENRRLYGGRQV